MENCFFSDEEGELLALNDSGEYYEPNGGSSVFAVTCIAFDLIDSTGKQYCFATELRGDDTEVPRGTRYGSVVARYTYEMKMVK